MRHEDSTLFESSRTPFTVVLSAGAATPIIGGPGTGDTSPHVDRAPGGQPQSSRNWVWQSSVSSLLHAVFARGGTVATRLDDELLPFVWGIARLHAQPVSAEHGETPSEPVVYALTTTIQELPDYWRRRGGRDPYDREQTSEPYAAAFESTGLVQAQLFRPDTREMPGPGPHFGIVLWPDETTDADLPFLSLADSVTIVRWWDDPPFEALGPGAEELRLEEDAPPLQFMIERLVDAWLTRGQGEPRAGF